MGTTIAIVVVGGTLTSTLVPSTQQDAMPTYVGIAIVVGAIGIGIVVRVLVRSARAVVARTIVVTLYRNLEGCRCWSDA